MSAAAGAPGSQRPLRLPLLPLQRASLWLLVFSGGFVIVEPSPYEVTFAAAALLFALTGLRFNARLAPLVVLLVLFNLGGAFALVPYLGEQPSVVFTAISVYMMVTSLFYAALMAEDTMARLDRRVMRSSARLSSTSARLPPASRCVSTAVTKNRASSTGMRIAKLRSASGSVKPKFCSS